MTRAMSLGIAGIVGAVVVLATIAAVNGSGLTTGRADAVEVTARPTRTPEGETPPPVTPTPPPTPTASPTPIPTASASPSPSPTPAPETLFANVADDGTLGYNHGALSVDHTANSGKYVIHWEHDINHCAAVSGPGAVGVSNTTFNPGYTTSYINGTFDTLTVDFYSANANHDSAFNVIVAC